MKYLKLLAFTLLFTNCQSQEPKLLLSQELYADISETPIYPRLTEEVNGQIGWRDNFKYLDSIEIYSLRRFDETGVSGFLSFKNFN